jgi:Cu/Ag efflux protein CusF
MLTLVCAIFALVTLSGFALGEEKTTINGTIKSIDPSINMVVITDKAGNDTTVVLEDKAKLSKFSVGDRVKVKITTKDGKNMATDFRKAPGC